MPQMIRRHSRVTLHRPIYPKWEQDQTEKKTNYGLNWLKNAYDNITQSWIINFLKMYKIWHEVKRKFIEKTMKTWRVYLKAGGTSSTVANMLRGIFQREVLSLLLTAGGRRLAETKVQRVIFRGDALSPLLFIIAIMPLNHILRKYITG